MGQIAGSVSQAAFHSTNAAWEIAWALRAEVLEASSAMISLAHPIFLSLNFLT